MPGSHDRNTPEVREPPARAQDTTDQAQEVEGVLVRVLDLRPSTKIPWCARCDRLMYQFLAGLRLSPGATGRQLPELARLMDCWFDPVRWPDFARVVWPKISASLEYKLKGLHDQHKIVNYVDPGGAWRTYWPDYTRAWALDNWDGSMAGTVDDVLRNNLIRHGTLDHLPSRAAPAAAAPRPVFGGLEPPGMSRVAEWVDATVPSSSSQPSTSQPGTSQLSTLSSTSQPSTLSSTQPSTLPSTLSSTLSSTLPETSLPETTLPETSLPGTSQPGTQPGESQAGQRSSTWSEGGSTLLSTGASAVGPRDAGRRRSRRGRRGHGGAATAGGSPAEILAMMRAVLAQQNPAVNGGGG